MADIQKFPPLIEFKEHEQQLQFRSPLIDSRLIDIIYYLAGFSYFNYGKSITITELLRSQAEQDEIYKDDPIYKQNPWQSVHQYGRGADISILYYTDDEKREILKYLNGHFSYREGGTKETAIIHEVGNHGMHLHVQVSPESYTQLLKV